MERQTRKRFRIIVIHAYKTDKATEFGFFLFKNIVSRVFKTPIILSTDVNEIEAAIVDRLGVNHSNLENHTIPLKE